MSFIRGGNRSEHFRCYFAMGKIRGTPCMRSHISVHRATIKYFSNSFIFKTEIEKEGLPRDITPALGAGGPGSNPGAPTKLFKYLAEQSISSPEPGLSFLETGTHVHANEHAVGAQFPFSSLRLDQKLRRCLPPPPAE